MLATIDYKRQSDHGLVAEKYSASVSRNFGKCGESSSEVLQEDIFCCSSVYFGAEKNLKEEKWKSGENASSHRG